MRYHTLRGKLRVYLIRYRLSTIRSAFARALPDFQGFDEALARRAVTQLGQDPDKDLTCIYCGGAASGWDHVYSENQPHSEVGYGHALGNFVPSCDACMTKKGSKTWREYMESAVPDPSVRAERVSKVQRHLDRYAPPPISSEALAALCPEEIARFRGLLTRIEDAAREADEVAEIIRRRVVESTMSKSPPVSQEQPHKQPRSQPAHSQRPHSEGGTAARPR